MTAMAETIEREICECGDYREDHPNDGPCVHNGLGPSRDLTHGFENCRKFRLAGTERRPIRKRGEADG